LNFFEVEAVKAEMERTSKLTSRSRRGELVFTEPLAVGFLLAKKGA